MKSNPFKIVDLSHPLSNSTLVYPGDPGINIARFKSIRLNNTAVSSLTFGSHSGTHLDAPCHVIENGAGLNQMEPMNYFGVGRCLDVRNREQITDRDIPANIAAGQAVFFRTGHAQYWNSEKYYQTRPCLTTEAADALIKRGVLAVGVDTPSVDAQGTQKKNNSRKIAGKKHIDF
ncbi:MAG: cyclase family protein [Parcubacteria group bacterium]